MRHHHERAGREITDIDPDADIELTSSREHMTARIPLAGQVTGEWLGCYHRLAHAASVPVRAEARSGRAWLVVTVPAASSHAEIAGTLDAARALITEADTATLPARNGGCWPPPSHWRWAFSCCCLPGSAWARTG
jgi:hypothetical protein